MKFTKIYKIAFTKKTSAGEKYGIEISGENCHINLLSQLETCYGNHDTPIFSLNRCAFDVLSNDVEITITGDIIDENNENSIETNTLSICVGELPENFDLEVWQMNVYRKE
jgi:hypothetical protein